MGHNFPFFFLMKKKAAAYGLLDGHIVPRSTCSLRNFCSSSSSNCESHIFRLMRVAGAPGFSSMAWFYDCFGGNFFDSWSLNTRACFWYCRGTKLFGSFTVGGAVSMRPTMVWDIGLI